MSVLGVILARAGSKRLPGKNVRDLCGKPLIAWTIEAARASRLLTDLVCSTDDERVIDLCVEMGVDVVLRPAELATDAARSEDAILHALMGYSCDYVCLLQPTSPLRTAEDIDACVAAAVHCGGAAITESMSNPGEPNGAVYVAAADWFRARGFTCHAIGVVMPSKRSVDIDTADDFERAEKLMSVREVV